MPDPGETPSTRPIHPANFRAAVSGDVAQDLEAIFPHAPIAAPAAGQRLRLRSAGAGAAQRPSGERRAAVWGAVIAAACVGVSAGALMSRGGARAVSAPAPAPAAVAQPATVLAAATPAPASPATALPSPGPLAPPPVTRASLPEPAKAAPTAKPHAAKLRKDRVRKAETRRRTAARSVCGGRCDHGDVMAADRRLRRAYASAVRAGVARSVLVSYRNRWAGLRHRAPRQPALVVARYNAMAGDLNRLAGRSSLAAQRHGNSWRSAALW